MGIIQRQSFKNSVISMAGVLIGGLSVLFVYPLDDEIYGLAQFLYSTAWFLVPLASMGVLPTILRFYPRFKDENRNDNGFLLLIITMLISAIAVFLVLFFLFKDAFYSGLDSLGLDAALISDYQPHILILMIILAFVTLFQYQAQNFHRIVVPQLIIGFSYKIFLPLLVLSHVFKSLDPDRFSWSVVGFFGLVLLAMIVYTKAQGQLKLKSPFKTLEKGVVRKMLVYSSFTGLSAMGSMLTARIDTIMVATMISLTANGVYNKVLFIAAVIDIPTRAIIQIASPIISEHFENNKLDEIKKLYKQSSLNLIIAGIGIFLLIWFTIDHVFGISVDPQSFTNGKMVFLLLAIGKLFDMLTSVNTQIIMHSKVYKVNLFFILFLGVMNLFLNYHFIGRIRNCWSGLEYLYIIGSLQSCQVCLHLGQIRNSTPKPFYSQSCSYWSGCVCGNVFPSFV